MFLILTRLVCSSRGCLVACLLLCMLACARYLYVSLIIYIYIYIYVHTYIYIYIHRERETDLERDRIMIMIMMYIFIYIYIYIFGSFALCAAVSLPPFPRGSLRRDPAPAIINIKTIIRNIKLVDYQ